MLNFSHLVQSLQNIEYRENNRFFFEIQDEYFKSSDELLPLPNEFSSIQNKRTLINSSQQLECYIELLKYGLDNCKEEQKPFIQLILDFVKIYQNNLKDISGENVEFYFYGEKEVKCEFVKEKIKVRNLDEKEVVESTLHHDVIIDNKEKEELIKIEEEKLIIEDTKIQIKNEDEKEEVDLTISKKVQEIEKEETIPVEIKEEKIELVEENK